MGGQRVPPDVGTEIGPPYPPRRGHPKPREIESQKAQVESGRTPGRRKDVKARISAKVRGAD